MRRPTYFSSKILKNIEPYSFADLCKIAGVEREIDISVDRRFIDIPVLAVVLNELGLPMYAATMFLAERAVMARSMTGATVITYAEGLVCWLHFLKNKTLEPEQATEETLGLFRASLANGKQRNNSMRYASSTANLRVVIVAIFHEWAQKTGILTSPLGMHLITYGTSSTYKRNFVRIVRRHPRVLSQEEISAILAIARQPYRLMFQWALTTGARRFEICNLTLDQLPASETLGYAPNDLISIPILRKGGRDLPLIVPVHLLERTHWYCLTERPQQNSVTPQNIFVNNRRKKIQPVAFTNEFRRCARLAGSDATLHFLRHTYATKVLDFLQRSEQDGNVSNPLKTLQVLLGHAKSETTQIYVHSLSINSPAVYGALSFLYGMAE
ncbi:integrase [Massilia sp. MP_M2]|uniref:tyrosine-type recombinase/integrase n=1 Tax=Massilia sp. MP_M2 TaxID=3071713 RepID=UPI00319E3BD6